MNEQDELAQKFLEELQSEFMENNINGDDIYTSMLKGMAKVLANVYRELGGHNEQ